MTAEKYTEDHEWVRIEGDDLVVVGITAYAQEQLGDLVHADLPQVGQLLSRGDEAAVIESVKAAGEIKSPVSGTVTAVNGALIEDPSLPNQDPLGDGWFFRIRLSDPAELDTLMDEIAYRRYLAN
ncbi:MAG: glycine cleavage system protein GcvH [Aquisalimonadaceae bacterium]